ncbi:MAG: Fic family protein [Deltaproteobacteria bacterium]|nr:Fic family protein [Deltaproteobacteria bacterium]
MLQKNAGLLLGVWRHLDDADRGQLTIEVLTSEAITTSAIEGEQLDRASVQSSLQRRLGLVASRTSRKRSEEGVAELMVSVYRDFNADLTKDTLCSWHVMLCGERRDLDIVGDYRRHREPMVIVSGPEHEPRVHFEAPPSERVPAEMEAFIDWFNASGPSREHALPPLVRASIAHLYFETVHPFEDGNGRIGRALVAKSLAQSLQQPILFALSEVLMERRRRYYDMLQKASRSLQIDEWIQYFGQMVLTAQESAIAAAEFVIAKNKFLTHHSSDLNGRQLKALAKTLNAGPGGFEGGLSAEKYISITRTSRATATRDLGALVAIGALTKTGSGKGTRYHLKIAIDESTSRAL